MKYLLYAVIFVLSECTILPSIPSHLRPCYLTGAPELVAPRRLDVFLSLIRKVELHTQLDMRMITPALLRSLRLDGIEQLSATAVETEFVLPFRASAFQFHKYKLLMDLFLPSQNLVDVDEILTLSEKCLLHRMISSTVRQWERGDENVACPLTSELSQNMISQSNNSIISRCPIEDGVIQTEWGTISPGTVMAAVASSLESQRVSLNDIFNANIYKEDVAEPLINSALQDWFENIETLATNSQKQMESVEISNIWVATLGGDLAEVVVNQGPRVGASAKSMIIGTNNRWNDTLLPRALYIFPQNASIIDWHITDAEILAGIDGLILSRHIPKWVEQRRTLRLSQVIDMYYSNEGISFDTNIKACNRLALFTEIFESSELRTEVTRFASVLSLRQITVYIPQDEMERITDAAVTAFTTYLASILRQNQRECQLGRNIPVMDLVVATDGSWRRYDTEQFLSWVSGALEMNLMKSTISLLHGNTGAWIAPPSNNLTALFSHVQNFTDTWPNRLNLPNIVSTIIQYSLNKTLYEIETQASAGVSTVVLIISPSDRPSTAETERARTLMNSLRTNYFDVYFSYVAQDLTDFQNINNEYLDYSELFVTTSSTSVTDVISAVDMYDVKSDIPMRLMGAQCTVNDTVFDQVEYEDFVLPNRRTHYRIHPFFLRQQSLVQVQFRNDGQGRLLICTWRGADASHSCQTLSEREVFTFNFTTPCPSIDFCPPANIATTAINTSNLCANNDCRLPHQVGYYIRHTGLRCLPLKGSASNNFDYGILYIYLILIAILLK